MKTQSATRVITRDVERTLSTRSRGIDLALINTASVDVPLACDLDGPGKYLC